MPCADASSEFQKGVSRKGQTSHAYCDHEVESVVALTRDCGSEVCESIGIHMLQH